MDPYKYFQMAADVAVRRKDTREHKIGAVGLRKDGAIVLSANGSVRGAGKFPVSHAEVRLSRKLDVGSTVFVCRVAGFGNWLLAKPCPNCERTLKRRGVRRVYYTIYNSEYGVIEL
jgi:tRNA(Arg) A34 adenosine deaminase TadA